MTKLPANRAQRDFTPPSLTHAFSPERAELEAAISAGDWSAGQIVSRVRGALDRSSQRFAEETPDPGLRRAGLWLMEMVKSGAGTIDSAAKADIIWHEVTPPPANNWKLRTALFYFVAAGIFLLAFVDGSRLGMMGAVVLTLLRAVDSDMLSGLARRIPFIKKPVAIADESGRQMKAEAHIRIDGRAYVDSLCETLKTADHILLQLSEPEAEYHWRDDRRLMAFIQSLLEAGQAKDGDFALTLIRKQLGTLLQSEGIRRVEYTNQTASLFDVLPAPGTHGTQVAVPALMAGDDVISRGTVWRGESNQDGDPKQKTKQKTKQKNTRKDDKA